MKNCTRIISLILIVAILTPLNVFAEEDVAPYGSNYFSATETYIYRINGNTIGVWFYALAKREMDQLGASYIQIERSADKQNWTSVATYTSLNYSQLMSSGVYQHGNYVPYVATYGYYYRAYVRFCAKEDGATAYFSWYTNPFYV